MKTNFKCLVSSMLERLFFLCHPRRIIWFWVGLAGVFSVSSLKVDVSAKGAVLMNAETGMVLWEKNAHLPLPPASTTKMITALYTIERKGQLLNELVEVHHDEVVAVSPQVRRGAQSSHPPYRLEFGGTHIGLQAGEVLPLRSLLDGLMLASGNDAANVIAHHVSGDILLFMKELNAFVRAKGCQETTLYTPHGLPYEGHKTSAYDLALLARAYLAHPVLREIASQKQAVRPQTNKQPESLFTQHNALLKPGKFYYPKAMGIKTGYTVAAGYCIVTSAQDENRHLIAVLLGCDQLDQRYQDAIALFEAGFNEERVSRILFSKGFDRFTHLVEGGRVPIQAQLIQDLVLDYYPSEEPRFTTRVVWDCAPFPIQAGQKVARLQVVSAQGTPLLEAPLYAMNTVEATWGHRVEMGWGRAKTLLSAHLALVMASSGVLLLAGSWYVTYRPRRKRE